MISYALVNCPNCSSSSLLLLWVLLSTMERVKLSVLPWRNFQMNVYNRKDICRSLISYFSFARHSSGNKLVSDLISLAFFRSFAALLLSSNGNYTHTSEDVDSFYFLLVQLSSCCVFSFSHFLSLSRSLSLFSLSFSFFSLFAVSERVNLSPIDNKNQWKKSVFAR